MHAAAVGIVSELRGLWLAESDYCVPEIFAVRGATWQGELRMTKTPRESYRARNVVSEPKSPLWWAPVETVLRRPSCTQRSAKGRNGRLR